ncbi:hypothetical protein chiPu_0010736 [Chiloscyllium punctatum]|uniref:G-protein coupled receptors family 3 profile domain-containing protein n=1 Tax=Chiloscyllium punctatum TaxID=137246 RepID=A0A401SPE3_CHIPU|nr:hypothetical protein [Chiloscyllium punctatum]
MYCESFDISSFRLMQTMIFAIEEINRSKNLLPNITLGYEIYDDCSTSAIASKAALVLVNGEEELIEYPDCKGSSNVAAIIGCDISTSSITAARTVGAFGIPMISYFSTCSCLSDKQEYPTFFRTIPSDKHQSKLLAELVKTFGWNWIGTVRSNTDYGNFGMRTFVKEAQKIGICIAYSESFHRTDSAKKIHKIVQVMKEATTKVVVGFLHGTDMRVLIKEILRQNVTGIQWIGSEGWITEDIFSPEERVGFLTGAIGPATRRTEVAGLRDHLLKIHPSRFPESVFVKTFWETLFSCSLTKGNETETRSSTFQVRSCTGNEHLNGLENAYLPAIMDGSSYHVYKAVYAVAHALDDMLSCEEGNGPFMNNACAHISRFQPGQLLHYLQLVNFTAKTGEVVYFDENGDPVPTYDIVNLQMRTESSLEIVNIGYYEGSAPEGEELVLNTDDIMWSSTDKQIPRALCSEPCSPGTRKVSRKGQPICCFDCAECGDGEISNTTDSIDCVKCPLEYWSNQQKDRCVPKKIEFLSFQEVLAYVLVALALVGVCLALGTAAESPGMVCKSRGKGGLPNLSEDGDIIVGGIFAAHLDVIHDIPSFAVSPSDTYCESFDIASFRLIQTMIFAIEEINQSKTLLPNITLGYAIYDDCSISAIASEAALALVNGGQELIEYPDCKGSSNVAAIIGCDSSTSSIAAARTVGTFGIPMISYFATCSCLSDKQEYPTFFRTIPSDKYQSKLLAELVKTFGWNWIGTVRSNTDYGNFGMRTFIEEAQKIGVCIAYSESFYRTDPAEKISKIVQVMKEATTKVVVGFLQKRDMRVLIEEILRQNVTGIQWIGTEGWLTGDTLFTEERARARVGAIGPTTRRTEIVGLRDHLLKIHPTRFPDSTFVKEFWENLFSCSLTTGDTTDTRSSAFQVRPCTGNEHLDGLENTYLPAIMDGSSYHVYKAVYAVAHALDDMLSCEENNGPFMNSTCAQISSFEPWQLLHYLHSVNFTASTGELVYFDENGDPVPKYDLINLQMNAEDSSDCIKCPLEYWSNQQKDRCVPKMIEFLSFQEVLGYVLVALASVGACLALATVAFHPVICSLRESNDFVFDIRIYGFCTYAGITWNDLQASSKRLLAKFA